MAKKMKKLESFPSWVRTFFIGKFIPYTGTSNISYDVVTPEKLVVSIKNKKPIRNHIGQVHATAMILLAETATGIVVAMNTSDDQVVLIKSLKTSFVRRSKGDMKAVAHLTKEQQEYIKVTPKGETLVPVIVTDSTGEQPIIVEALWAWVPKNKIS